jgi:hypothetical protein
MIAAKDDDEDLVAALLCKGKYLEYIIYIISIPCYVKVNI